MGSSISSAVRTIVRSSAIVTHEQLVVVREFKKGTTTPKDIIVSYLVLSYILIERAVS